MRPRFSKGEITVLLGALDFFIEKLDKETRGTPPAPLWYPFKDWPQIHKARMIKTKLLRDLKGMKGRTNKNYWYLWGELDSPFQRWQYHS